MVTSNYRIIDLYNIISTIIFATFYVEIVVKWLKTRIWKNFQLEHMPNAW